jgi:hypothetical protein
MGVGDWMVIYGDLMVVSSWFSGILRFKFNGVFLGDLRGG